MEEWGVDGKGNLPGHQQEVFDAKVFAILRAVRLLSERGEEGQAYTIFSDSQAAVSRA